MDKALKSSDETLTITVKNDYLVVDWRDELMRFKLLENEGFSRNHLAMSNGVLLWISRNKSNKWTIGWVMGQQKDYWEINNNFIDGDGPPFVLIYFAEIKWISFCNAEKGENIEQSLYCHSGLTKH